MYPPNSIVSEKRFDDVRVVLDNNKNELPFRKSSDISCTTHTKSASHNEE